MTPTEFHTDPDREAVATIAGFCYQVDQTIHHWLRLRPGESLVLEGAEDIDVVARELSAPDVDQERLLVQVKRLAGAVTLRSPAVVAAIAHLAGHQERNPAMAVRMEFLTTGRAGRERPNPYTPSKQCLLRWNELASQSERTAEDDQDLGVLQRTLSTLDRPSKGVSDHDWSSLAKVLSYDIAGFAAFVRGLSWSLGASDSATIVADSQQGLVAAGFCPDEGAAVRVYELLFAKVFRALASDDPGDRVLTRDGLGQFLAGCDATELSREAARVRASVAQIEARLSAVESRVAGHDEQLAGQARLLVMLASIVAPVGGRDEVPRPTVSPGDADVASSLNALIATLGTTLSVGPGGSLDPPPDTPLTVARPRAEADIGNRLAACRWVHVWGSIRTGKTSLVRRVVTSDGARVVWVRLRGADPLVALRHAAWSLDAGAPDAVGVLVRAVVGDGVLVLDDLPDLSDRVELRDFMMELARRMSGESRLITTGATRLPRLVREALPVQDIGAPRFANADVEAVLRARGAPVPFVTDRMVSVIQAVTAGHAERVNQCVAVLASRGWVMDATALAAIFSPETDTEQRATILRQVSGTVSSNDARDLLFRLCLLRTPFDDGSLRRVAAVPPSLRNAGVLRASLDGLWLELESNDRWSVSPAIEPFGSGELDEATRTSVHLAIASDYLRNRRLTPIEVGWAMHHFEAGGDANSAAVMLLQYLNAVMEQKAFRMDPGLAERWPLGLPQAMRPELRVLVRATQARVIQAGGGDPSAAVAGLMAELEGTGGAPSWSVRGAALLAHEAASRFSPMVGARLLQMGIEASVDSSVWVVPEHVLVLTVHLHMLYVTRPEYVPSWLSLLRALPATLLTNLTESADFAVAAKVLANKLWMTELEKPVDQRDWDPARSALNLIAQAGRDLGVPVLTACAIAAQLVIQGEYLLDVPAVLALGDRTAAELPPGLSRTIVEDTVGRQLVYGGRESDGVPRLERALADFPAAAALALDRFFGLGAMTLGYSRYDLKGAIDAARRRVALARGNPRSVPLLELVAALGELAIAIWRGESAVAAFPPMDEAAELLLSATSRNEAWRDRFVVFGHVNGFLASMAVSGRPPGVLIGGEAYAPPRQGMFGTSVEGRSSLFQEHTAALLPGQLMSFAVAAGDVQRGLVWAGRACELATRAGLAHMSAEAEQLLAADSFCRGDSGGGLARLQRYVLAMEAVRERHSGDQSALWAPGPDPVLSALAADRRAIHGQWLERVASLPAAVALVQLPIAQVAAEAARVSAFFEQVLVECGPDSVGSGLVEIFRALESGEGSTDVLRRFASSPPDGLDPTSWAVAHLLLGRSEVGEPLSRRLSHHLRFAQALERMSGELGHCYRLFVLPYFVDHWLEVARRSSFLLRNPKLVMADLVAAREGLEEGRLRRTLLIMCDGLDVTLVPRMRAWLTSGE